ncbi:MAG: MFS transporter [Spirochaetia bacterium]
MAQLSVSKKVAYAFGSLSMNLANLIISQWLLRLYVPNRNEALVGTAVFSIIFLFGRIIDGVTDPLVGHISDNFQSKHGRRLPFIRAMILPTAIASFLLWTPPLPGVQHWINSIYIFIMVQCFFIFWTILANPYMSLLPELTTNLKERVNISTMQAVFLLIGTIIFAFIGPIKAVIGWKGMGALLGGLVFITFLPTALFIRERYKPDKTLKDETTLKQKFEGALTTFQNKPFRILLTATSLFWFSLNMITLLIPFWIETILGRPDSDVALVMAPFLGANIIFFFIFNWMSKRFGKRIVFLITLAGSAVSMPLLVIVGMGILPGTPLFQTQVIMGFIGIFVAGFMMLPYALLSDVIDFDSQHSRKRREGIFFGVQSIFQKSMIGVSIIAASFLMYLKGNDIPTEFGLKAITVTAGISAAIAFFIFILYPLKERDGVILSKTNREV